MRMNSKLKETTRRFIELNGFEELTKVQEEVLKYTSSSRDVIALSKTGTGKTHAYLIPVMEMINPVSDKTQVLISLPTREMAYQVYQNCLVMKEVYPDLRIQLLAGGTDKKKSISKMENTPHIVIGTPGRIKDLFLNAGALRIDKAKILVVDEADMTLEYGFLDEIDAFAGRLPDDLQMMAFSATMPDQLRPFLRKYMQQPVTVEIGDKV